MHHMITDAHGIHILPLSENFNPPNLTYYFFAGSSKVEKSHNRALAFGFEADLENKTRAINF